MPVNQVSLTSTNFNIHIIVTYNKNKSRMKYTNKKNQPVSKSRIDENSSPNYMTDSFDEYCGECSADDLNSLKLT